MAATSSRSKFFSWGSKSSRQSTQEPYYRTGGLLPIDVDVGNQVLAWDDAEDTTWRPNPKNLSIVPPNYITSQSPHSIHQNDVPVRSTPNLLAVFSDLFPSSGVSPTACVESSDDINLAPLSKKSLPPSPALPAELPGSILLDNQGFPTTPPPDADSTPSSAVTSVRSMYSLNSNAAKPGPSKVLQHRKSANEPGVQRRSRSRPSVIASPTSTDSKLTTCSISSNENASSANSTKSRVGPETLLQPAQVIVEGEPWKNKVEEHGVHSLRDELRTGNKPASATRNKQLDELKATITAQDQTISTLQSQFASLRVSHEAHVSSLVNAHSLEISALKDYTRSLESQQRGLHHASSNHLLFLLDTTEPQSPNRGRPHSSAGSTPANSIRTFKTAFESSPRSPLRAGNNFEMENLKRKLSLARRPETGNGDAVRELNMYKQNNVALQKQVESLMTKLNQSKEQERNQRRMLEEVQRTCEEWQEKASNEEQLKKSTMALQNTIDHLEYRLEIANVEKIDAEEQLFNIRSQRTPFDPKTPKLQVPDNRQSTRTSMSTVFANDSPISQSGPHDPTTLAAFISHIERLQEQIREKDTHIAELEADNDRLRQNYDRLQSEVRELDLQSDIQGQLLTKAKQNELHIEELRTTIIKREAMIGEKSKALQQTERQLEHHKLLLEAEIRRHASFTLLADANDNPLPELTSLASKGDIDRWIERLQKQLNKDKAEKTGHKVEADDTVENLRREIDFYVREIIYYKLDCRGYKSDIKKLKRMAAQIGGHGSRPGEVDSPDPSVCKSGDTAFPAKFQSGTSGLGVSTSPPSSVSTGPISVTIPMTQRMTPPPSVITPGPSPFGSVKQGVKRVPKPLEFNMPMAPRTPPLDAEANLANAADNVDPGISPRSVARLSPGRRKPTPPSPDQERFGELATNFPLSTPAAPKRLNRRSVSDSVIQFSQPRTLEEASKASHDRSQEVYVRPMGRRTRSGSGPEPSRGKSTPERPPRPRFGLFDTVSKDTAPFRLQTPPRVDVMAEAMRSSPDQIKSVQKAVGRKPFKSLDADAPISPSKETPIRSSSSTADSALPAPLLFRPREGSTNSGDMPARTPSGTSRRPSTASSSNVPFVIAMGSPHNPALITPTASVPPTACSITGKLNVVAPTLRTGVGGTMASTTPVTSPVSPTDATKQPYFSSVLPSSKPLSTPPKSGSAPTSRNASISSRKEGEFGSSFAAPTAASRSRTTTPSHSRNVSAHSIRHAINLPARMDFIKSKGKSRKESISHPTPLASPFDTDCSTQHGWSKGPGKAL